jgi:hypothetical protein
MCVVERFGHVLGHPDRLIHRELAFALQSVAQ